MCCAYYITIILYTILSFLLIYLLFFLSSHTILFQSSSLFSFPLPSTSLLLHLPFSHSKYTCRVLPNLIYILSLSKYLTPHVLSEWMVEVCRFDEYRVRLCFDPACFIGWECRVVQFVFVSGLVLVVF